MSRLSPISAKKLIKFLKKRGYYEDRQSGSHLTLRNDTEHKSITIPVHQSKDIGKGLLKQILKDSGFSLEELQEKM